MSKDFEIARMLMLQAYHSGSISDVRAFSWSSRVFPLVPREIEEKFESDFTVTREQVSAALHELDTAWTNKSPIDYYTLEGRHGPGTNTNLDRMDLIDVCRMAFLDGRFDPTVWTALTVPGSGPIESQGLADPFNPSHDASL